MKKDPVLLSPLKDEIVYRRAAFVYNRLYILFGEPEWRQQPPLDELISTLLSQNTNDRNRDAAYQSLRAKYPTWEAVRDADPGAVIESIRTAGLANLKGPRIQRLLREITAERGSLDLEFLHGLPPVEARSWLLRFQGVGPKTAAIVLVFSLGMPAFPVDTHVHRVSGRLGLRPEKMTAEEAHDHMAALFPVEAYGTAHLNLIRLGREICHARKPDCQACLLRDLCPYPDKPQP